MGLMFTLVVPDPSFRGNMQTDTNDQQGASREQLDAAQTMANSATTDNRQRVKSEATTEYGFSDIYCRLPGGFRTR
jgi:hypothetical protein